MANPFMIAGAFISAVGALQAGNAAYTWYVQFDPNNPPSVLSQPMESDKLTGVQMYDLLASGELAIQSL